VLLLPMHGPKSYTGENTVEIHCHGGALITRRVLERVFQAGARPAQPGEFTFRAFLSGKMDLSQAEAVQELIAAKSELHLTVAEKQLQGSLSRKISEFQAELTDSAAILEAWVDFPEEGLEFASLEEIIFSLESTCTKMKALHATFHEGKILHHGLSLCLSGAPNVGKSSLMNALLGKERAIVTHIAGTTRDLLEADMRLGNFHFKLIDTAGIRTTEEIIEAEGIKRSRIALEEADIILFVVDASRSFTEEEKNLLATLPEEKTIIVWNKIDLEEVSSAFSYPQSVKISAKNHIGIDTLHTAIEKLIWKKGPPSKEEVLITNERHHQALSNAITSLNALISGLQTNISPEFLASDMRQTLIELGTIIGTNITEDILTAIFSKFCIGK
ncbi:MAG: tRNA uridine-5-carboxymethylaminomethyl(34) synthesis GTPase MnmE, partial [Chlamydiota bacterium]